jgi:hypothetical protein
MSEGNETGNNLIWAITMIIIVTIIIGAIYYSGVLNKKAVPDTDVDINVNPPAATK